MSIASELASSEIVNAHTAQQISMYINSPGGIVTSGMAVYDTMQVDAVCKADVQGGVLIVCDRVFRLPYLLETDRPSLVLAVSEEPRPHDVRGAGRIDGVTPTGSRRAERASIAAQQPHHAASALRRRLSELA